MAHGRERVMDGMTARAFQSPPRNLEAEQALLGAILVNNRAWEKVCDLLKPEHFADPIHGRIYEVCGQEIGAGRTANGTTLLHVFATDPEFMEIGGAEYITRLARAAVTVVNAAEYGNIVRDLYLRREIISVSDLAITQAYDTRNAATAPEQIEAAHARLEDIGGAVTVRRPAVTISETITTALEEADKIKGARDRGEQIPLVSTGLIALDDIIGGFAPGELIVPAGATSMGKTALAIGMALAEAKALRRTQLYDGSKDPPGLVYFQSNEMRGISLGQRVVASQADVSVHRIRNGWFHQDERNRLDEAAGQLRGLPLYIDDNAATGVREVRRRALELRRRAPLRLIIVDYLQLLVPSEKSQNRVNEVSAITRDLKMLAGELEVPVVALSQLSRGINARENKRPLLSDLRESGAIEQDADTVLFCYRPDYYEAKEKKPTRRENENKDALVLRTAAWEADVRAACDDAEIIVAKQRQGISDRAAEVRWEGRATRFVDLPGAVAREQEERVDD